MPELLNCPFCGGEARKWQDPSHSAAWFIGCDDGDRDCFGSFHWAETEAEAIASWNRRALPARGVGVKPLVWEDAAWAQSENSAESALSQFGRYYVKHGAMYWGPGVVVSTGYPTLDAAKAAAQADYEARILAALAPTDAPDTDLLFDAYKGLLVLHRTLDRMGLARGSATASRIADKIVAAHPEFPARTALRHTEEPK